MPADKKLKFIPAVNRLNRKQLLQLKQELEDKLTERNDLKTRKKYCSVLYWLEMWPECMQVCEVLLNDYPYEKKALETYCRACLFLGKYQKTLENITKLGGREYSNNIEIYKGQSLLFLRKFREGFTYFHSVLLKDKKFFSSKLPNIPEWLGEPLRNKRLIVLGDQGFGDKFLFARFFKLIRQQQPARIFFANLEEPLVKLFAAQNLADKVYAQRCKLPEADYYTHMVSLPIPLNINKDNYIVEHAYLHSDPELIKFWQNSLLPYKGLGLKIGIAWGGQYKNPTDRFRSINLAKLKSLFGIDNCCFFSLQKGHYYQQLLDKYGNINLIDLAPIMTEFNKTAALLSCLDVVITVDSALANLAGAMGLNAWLMLGKQREWRYGAADNKSWYPSLRIFEQPKHGDWDSVIANVKQALLKKIDQYKKQKTAEIIHTTPMNQVAKTRHGIMCFNQHDHYVGNSLKRYGEYSEAEVELFQQIIKPGQVVIEVGSNIGAHTIPLAQLVGPRGKVYAFEPQRLMFQNLCANTAMNGLTNIYAHQMAIGDKNGNIQINELAAMTPQNFGGYSIPHNQGDSEKVKIATLDSFAFKKCHFIKADVEGMEVEVLQGARKLIEQHKPVLYIENDRKKRSQQLLNLLQELGYRIIEHKPRLYKQNNFSQNKENVFGKIVSLNIVAFHSSCKVNVS